MDSPRGRVPGPTAINAALDLGQEVQPRAVCGVGSARAPRVPSAELSLRALPVAVSAQTPRAGLGVSRTIEERHLLLPHGTCSTDGFLRSRGQCPGRTRPLCQATSPPSRGGWDRLQAHPRVVDADLGMPGAPSAGPAHACTGPLLTRGAKLRGDGRPAVLRVL